MSNIQAISAFIEQEHGHWPTHEGSETVVETFRGEVVWQGVVEEFSTPEGHFYGWTVPAGDAGGALDVVIKRVPPVKTALDAVRVYVAGTIKAASSPSAS